MKFINLHIIIAVILSISLTSCSTTPNELKIAERVMEVHPDSALHILQKLQPQKYSSNANRALYGILLFQALNKNYMSMQPDSLIDFSIDYYLKQNDKPRLAMAYFYRGRKLKYKTEYEKASIEYYKSIDNCNPNSDYLLLGKIYEDLAAISHMQREYKESRKKNQLAASFYLKSGRTEFANKILVPIGLTYLAEKKYSTARSYFKKVYSLSKDSITIGITLNYLGSSFLNTKQVDSALYYFRKSLTYPSRGNNLPLRHCSLAEAFFNIDQYDSATIYAMKSLKCTGGNLFTRREGCRVIANAAYNTGDTKLMNIYMSKYQEYTDSIRTIESQTKATVIEQQHNSKAKATVAKQNLTVFTILLISSILLIVIISVYLYHQSKLSKQEIKNYKLELNSKQVFVNQSISNKIEELKSIQTETWKQTQPADREKLSKELYNNALHIDNWDLFSSDMNHAFNNIVDKLQTDHPTLSRKEISWCCLHLLDISNTDRVLLLETTTEGLYKLKQRVAQKLNLINTKELDTYLRKTVAIRN
jgi:tetratricopeptide (TPR) repeat protein